MRAAVRSMYNAISQLHRMPAGVWSSPSSRDAIMYVVTLSAVSSGNEAFTQYMLIARPVGTVCAALGATRDCETDGLHEQLILNLVERMALDAPNVVAALKRREFKALLRIRSYNIWNLVCHDIQRGKPRRPQDTAEQATTIATHLDPELRRLVTEGSFECLGYPHVAFRGPLITRQGSVLARK